MIAFVYSMNFDHRTEGEERKGERQQGIIIGTQQTRRSAHKFFFFFLNLATIEYMKRSDFFFF
jgi:hypothetical protein